MASTHSYVITVGTTPVPDGSLAMRRAERRGEVRPRPAAHRATAATPHSATLSFSDSPRPRGAHRAVSHRAQRPATGRHRIRRHRATDRRAAAHRATRRDVRAGRIIRTRESGVVVRALVPLIVLALITMVFVSAWFTATGAEAFANIVKP